MFCTQVSSVLSRGVLQTVPRRMDIVLNRKNASAGTDRRIVLYNAQNVGENNCTKYKYNYTLNRPSIGV